MRCCLQTLHEVRTEEAMSANPAKEGDRVKCKWCDSAMIFHDGSWEWDHKLVK